MSSAKLKIESAEVTLRDEKPERPAFTTAQPKSEAKPQKVRGPNFTPKSEFRSKRDFDHVTWTRQFAQLCKKWDREAYLRKGETK